MRVTVRPQGDDGATAVITAVLVSVLFGVAALAVDLGNAYSRDARIEAVADQAAVAAARALPDACDAADAAAELLMADGNVVRDDDDDGLPPTETQLVGDLTDGDERNGEVHVFTADAPTNIAGDLVPAGRPWDCDSLVATRVEIVTPPVTVDFGLAGAMGFRSVDVQATAAAALIAPLPVLPFAVPLTCEDRDVRTYVVSPPATGSLVEPVGDDAFEEPRLPSTVLSTEAAVVDAGGGVTFTVTGTPVADDADWLLEFAGTVDDSPVTGYTLRLPASDVLAAGGPQILGPVALDPARAPRPGLWTVRAGRTVQPGEEDVDGDGIVWGAPAQLRVTVGGSPPGLDVCNDASLAGDLYLMDGVGPLGGAVANGLQTPTRVGDDVVLAGLPAQASSAATLSNGLLARLATDGPDCGLDPDLSQGTWSIAGRTVTATNHARCYGMPTGDDGRPLWQFTDATLVDDPRFFLMPVVDTSVLGSAAPVAAQSVPVVGYKVGFLTDEDPTSVADGLSPEPCTALRCTGVTMSDWDGPIDRLRIVAFDPGDIDISGEVRLRDNGNPWLTGPLSTDAPRDVHLVG